MLVFPDLFGASDFDRELWGPPSFAWHDAFGQTDLFVAQNIGQVYLGALAAEEPGPAHGVVALTRSGQRVRTYLGGESDHLFVASAMLIGMLVPLAVISAVLVWQWRAHRGPIMATTPAPR